MEKDWKDMFPEDVLPAEEEASATEPTAEGDT
jgi:hypothetical protein